jgi:DNA-binding protein WhiA
LVAPARTLGAAARVLVQKDSEQTVITTPADIDAVLTAAGGATTTAAWRAATTARSASQRAEPGSGQPVGFDAANSARGLAAATAVIAEITTLFEGHGADSFPEQLRAAGLLRLAHPQLSLAELGALADPPMSKDALSGRLRRLRTYLEPHTVAHTNTAVGG